MEPIKGTICVVLMFVALLAVCCSETPTEPRVFFENDAPRLEYTETLRVLSGDSIYSIGVYLTPGGMIPEHRSIRVDKHSKKWTYDLVAVPDCYKCHSFTKYNWQDREKWKRFGDK